MYKNLYVSEDSNVKKINFDLRNKVSQRITRNGSNVEQFQQKEQQWDKKLSQLSSNIIVTFKNHMHHTSQRTNNHMGTNSNLSNKKFDLRQFLHNVKEFDLFEKYVN